MERLTGLQLGCPGEAREGNAGNEATKVVLYPPYDPYAPALSPFAGAALSVALS